MVLCTTTLAGHVQADAGRGSAGWSTRSRRSRGSSRRPAARARGPPSASHMIETNEADRIGQRADLLGRGDLRAAGSRLAARRVHRVVAAVGPHDLAGEHGRRPAAAGSSYSRQARASSSAASGVGTVSSSSSQTRSGSMRQRALDARPRNRRRRRCSGSRRTTSRSVWPVEQLVGAVGRGVVDDHDRRRARGSAPGSAARDSSSSSRRFQVTTTATTRAVRGRRRHAGTLREPLRGRGPDERSNRPSGSGSSDSEDRSAAWLAAYPS